MKSKKAIVLLSGGLDSTVSLYWARKNGYRCHALSFFYAQRHDRELVAARRISKKARVPLRTVKFSLPWSESALTDKSMRLPSRRSNQMSHSIPATYVPGRNTIFLSFAMSYADAVGASALVIGANAVDYSGYPDCRPRYLSAFEKVANLGSRIGTEGKTKIKILAPLLHLRKKDIILLGRLLKAPLHLTWSCYAGGKTPCQRCESCVIRARGFEEAGLP